MSAITKLVLIGYLRSMVDTAILVGLPVLFLLFIDMAGDAQGYLARGVAAWATVIAGSALLLAGAAGVVVWLSSIERSLSEEIPIRPVAIRADKRISRARELLYR